MKIAMNRLRRTFISLAICVGFLFLSLFILYKIQLNASITQNVTYSKFEDSYLISHAGGGLNAGRYSNSKEALDQSVDNGHKYIEIDITQTQNGEWVLMHSWKEHYFKYFIRFRDYPTYLFNRDKSAPQTAADFKNMKMRYELTPMTLKDFGEWLKDNPHVTIVTDIKGSNYECLKLIKNMMDGHTNQIIPQIYRPEEYSGVKQLGYNDIILTTYRYTLTPDRLKSLSKFATDNELFALTVPQKWINKDMGLWNAKNSTRLFTHTINNINTAQDYKSLGVSGFYTDYMIP